MKYIGLCIEYGFTLGLFFFFFQEKAGNRFYCGLGWLGKVKTEEVI